ncbi:hypothetical protein CBS101457_004124 [Exobasidium rhododendri]|nr:hypothetical protein CBS101457_004124 [Exobasidium rhododendri]
MFRNRTPPMPQPTASSSSSNYMSEQVQQLLALVLPEPFVTILASVSDLIYRLVLGQHNEPATYTSTLVPPVLLLLVTYLSVMLVYRSIRSFFSFLLFSVKWFAVLAAIMFIVAYSLGNGNVEKGARVAAQKGGLNMQSNSWSDALQSSPAAQQVAPYLLQQVKRNLGGMAAAMPLLQQASQKVMEVVQGTGAVDDLFDSGSKQNTRTREYRDVRPAKKRFSFSGDDDSVGSRKSSQSYPRSDNDKKRRASGPSRGSKSTTSDDSAFERIAKFMGADSWMEGADVRGKQKTR